MIDVEMVRQDVAERNRFRAEFGLSPVSTDSEIERLRELERDGEFFRFFSTAPLRQRVEAKMLAMMRRQFNEPHWIPTGQLSGGGYWHYTKVRNFMFWLHRRQEGNGKILRKHKRP